MEHTASEIGACELYDERVTCKSTESLRFSRSIGRETLKIAFMSSSGRKSGGRQALNRYYYQSTIPLKDAVVISRFRDRGIRLEWRHRIEGHDGDLGTEGESSAG
jgi:hypothetical protein